MAANDDIKIITITPGKHRRQHVIAAIAQIAQIKSDGMTVCEVHTNKDTGTIEILAQKIREFEIYAQPGVVLPAPTVKALSPRRDESNMRKNYNRVQNAKYNSMLRNYKGRKR